MNRRSRHRGEPLVALVAILLSWVGLRAALWQQPYVSVLPGLVALRPIAAAGMQRLAHAMASHGQSQDVAPGDYRAPALTPMALVPALGPWRPEPLALRPDGGTAAPADTTRPGMAAANQLLWMAAMADLPSPQALLGNGAGDVVPDLARVRAGSERRWSGDGWLMWRQGSTAAVGGVVPPTYGASQGGVVLRYRLAPSSALQPMLYLRVTGAMDGSGQADSAFGFSARPISGLPLVAAVEGRVSRFSNGSTHLRPAAMVITELMPQPMPFAMRAEMYGAAGYVGGPASTAFIDGQLRVDHHVASIGPSEIRAGAGLWGGAQQGAGRLDVGPTASVRVASDHFAARLGVDWRLRVAGDAAPTSGPAVTLSTGF